MNKFDFNLVGKLYFSNIHNSHMNGFIEDFSKVIVNSDPKFMVENFCLVTNNINLIKIKNTNWFQITIIITDIHYKMVVLNLFYYQIYCPI